MSSAQNMTTRNTVLFLMVLGAIAMRFVSYSYPVLSNFTPVGAVALFAGTYFTDKWKAYLLPLAVLFLSNIGLNYLYMGKFVAGSWFDLVVFACFAFTVFIGSLIKKMNAFKVLAGSVVSALVFWLVTDLPWFYGNAYSHDMNGYLASLNAALPFLRNMIQGDLVYGVLLYGGFELAKNRYTILQSRHELAM